MSLIQRYYHIEDVSISEEDKSKFDYLSQSVDFYISALVREKEHIRKARNLYDGVRDKEEFAYLEQVFGIETPMSVKMTPLVKTKIDVLIGIFLDEEYTYRISMNDAQTINNIEAQKMKKKSEEILKKLEQFKKDTTEAIKAGKESPKTAYEESFIENLNKTLNSDFVSQYEIAAQSLIKFFEQDPTIDLKQKLKQYLLDLLITGEAYYRTYIDREGEDPKLEICKPENVFFSKNTNFQFLSNGNEPNVTAVVHRTYMTRTAILNKWGHVMTDEQKTILYGKSDSSGAQVIRDPRQLDRIYELAANTTYNQHLNSMWDTLPVYHVEWLANNEVEIAGEDKESYQVVETIKKSKYYSEVLDKDLRGGKDAGYGEPNKKGYRLDRYEGVRIGWDIYLNLGKSKNPPRSISAPWKTTLSINGVGYNDRNTRPYSVALSLEDLQNSYDVITFFRDNLIANAGVDGSRVNLAAIPKVLGQDFMERLLKFVAFRKQGLELYDPTEEGAGLFQHYGDFRGSLNGNIIQQLNVVLESIQAQADIVTGINRYMYAAAEQRDAVTNVKTGIKQTSLITKDLFELVFDSRKFVLIDLLNQAKITYKEGKKGAYIVGHRNILFNASPENFRFTDFNIQLVNSSKENLKLEKLNALAPQLAGKGSIEDEVLMKLMMTDSITEANLLLSESIKKKKEENNQLQQMAQQLEQLSEQAKQLQTELEKTQKEKEKLEKSDREYKMQDLEIRKKESEERIKISERRLDLDEKTATAEVEKDKEVVRLEREQLYAENVAGNAREIKNNL
jgi:hypothetical protein